MSIKIDNKKVEYDGNSIRLIVEDEEALIKKLQEKQAEILKQLEFDEIKDLQEYYGIDNSRLYQDE